MPYVHCSSCRLATFSAAGHSSRDECPRCGEELAARARPLFLSPESYSARGPQPVDQAADVA